MSEPSQIKKLDDAVINRIAAGEIIQRPANALKELIENSLDAKSSNIQITVKNGGLKLLQIQDNGTGIRREDFEIVCERFTTSKLREFNDLTSIATYGFRGEALASISHVAHLTITSKTANEKCAYRASYEDGKLKDAVKPTAGNQGTLIVVENLFYNMSIRQKALKSVSEEYQKISDVVGKYAVHNAHVGFGLKKQGENNDIRTPPSSTRADNIRIVYGSSIARELIEFDLENDAYRFKATGLMTNVNYSTKKFVFLLFINHRLVDCQSLKKCIDQVYLTYLPKNMHPFVYLSLELDPKSLDVNVHPTKHEVHFFNEDRIIEQITSAVETKLLGSNNSRVFFMQAKLPTVQAETIKVADKERSKTNVHEKDLVRTDSSEQKLTKFFGAPGRKSDVPARTANDESNMEVDGTKLEADESAFDLQKHGDLAKKRDDFEMMVLDTTVENVSANPGDTQLRSVLELRMEAESKCSKALRELFAQHVFVGCVSPLLGLVQHNTKMYLCGTQKIMRELFYQFVLYNFANFGVIKFSDPLPVRQLALVALDLPETGWEPADGEKMTLALRIAEILTDKGDMLKEYFNMEIDEYGNLKSLPILIDKHVPDMSGLPLYVLRLATEVNWEVEKECFHGFAIETAAYYSNLDESISENWKWTTEHVFYPAIKDYFMPPKEFAENAAVLEVADLPKLYKVFERC